jgi:thiol-disulfide isomerase/thioredoxin
MRPTRLASLLPIALIASTLFASAPEPSAESVLTAAQTQAQQQHKNILVTFDASWCGNCRLFDRMLADPIIGPLMSKSFVHVNLTTGERPGDTRHSNTPGGLAYEDALGGQNAGWPYLAMLDPTGKLLVDSFRPDHGKQHADNIGYPATPPEIAWFVHMLQVAAPNLTAAELTTVQTWLQKHSPV